MKLYHGTNINFETIDLAKTKLYKDFGQGFYLTDIRSQAENFAAKKSDIFGGIPYVLEYEFDENLLLGKELNVLIFDNPNKEWAEFIFKNRSRKIDFHHEYDIVYGPIANDGVAYLLGRYEEGTISITELIKRLRYRDLNNQYFFGTTKAIQYLKRI